MGVPGSSWFAGIIVNISKMIDLYWYNCSESRVCGTDCEGKFLLTFIRWSLCNYIPRRRFPYDVYFYYFFEDTRAKEGDVSKHRGWSTKKI